MSAYKIFLNCFLGGCAIFIFLGVAKMMKAKTSRGLTVAYALMGISVVIGIALDVIQAFFLSNADEKRLWIIQKLNDNVVGYYLGLATFFILCIRFEKKEKTPTQSSEPTRNPPAD